MQHIVSFLAFLLYILPIILSIAFFTLAERKVMSTIQRRKGPNIVGFGILQPIADALKLIIKEVTTPSSANFFIFIIAPLLSIIISLITWSIIPFNHSFIIADVSLSIFFFLSISSLNIYGIILAGWASDSKFGFLGSLRSIAQMISYEISLGVVLLPIVFITGSLNFYDIIYFQTEYLWLIIPLFPSFCFFFIILLVETNRAPFDLPEAEAELVAGYNIEYGSIFFALFFLAEYNNILIGSAIQVILFFGGFTFPGIFYITNNLYLISIIESFIFSIKIISFCFLFILIRALLPRFRYDHLMEIGWKLLLPSAFSFFFLVITILLFF